jgi:hypothetical protein
MSGRILQYRAVCLALHPVRQMKWLKIWNLMELLTKCDNQCGQRIISGAVYLAFRSVRQMEWFVYPLKHAVPNKQTLDELENEDVLHSSQRFSK